MHSELLQLTLSVLLNHHLPSIFSPPFLHFSLPFQFPLSALLPSLLPSFSPPFLYFSSLSPRPLLSPGGMRQAGRFAVCAAVMA